MSPIQPPTLPDTPPVQIKPARISKQPSRARTHARTYTRARASTNHHGVALVLTGTILTVAAALLTLIPAIVDAFK